MDVGVVASIAKHTIVCFVMHYVKDFQGQPNKRHNIVKAYTIDEIFNSYLTISDEDIPLAARIASATSGDTSNTNMEMQLFTPTTKKVLEEIAHSSNYSPKADAAIVGVKKNLGFAETNPTPNNISSESTAKTSTTNSKDHPLPCKSCCRKSLQEEPRYAKTQLETFTY
ncbi:hypothetical protein ACH5RR_017614 [Cinchona calisaya]|uniref:Uncharacterized protein n=1 Tax=Cinchona calisaya TaxID=153742 RepID=A0ABD2ZMP1_9GENT